MNRDEIFSKFGITVTGKEGVKYTCGQLVRLFVKAKAEKSMLLIPAGQDEAVLDKFAKFINDRAEAFSNVKPGLKPDWFAGSSLFSADGKKLYFFLFSKAGAPLMVKGIMNKKHDLTFLPDGKKVEQDKSLGLGEGPGTIWLCLKEEDVNPDCTVIKLSCSEPIKLYNGTGAPITQN